MSAADRCRAILTPLFADFGAKAMSGAHEHLVRLCQRLHSTRTPANEALAELINVCILGGKRVIWEQLIAEFGAGVDLGPSTRMVVTRMDAVGQQELLGRALAAHRRTVAWIYKVGLVLETTFTKDEQYREWRTAEDALQERLQGVVARPEMEVLAQALSRRESETSAAFGA